MAVGRFRIPIFVAALILIGIATFCVTNMPERYNSAEKLKETVHSLVHGTRNSGPNER